MLLSWGGVRQSDQYEVSFQQVWFIIIINIIIIIIIIVGAMAQNNELDLGPVRGGNVAQRSTF